MRKILLFAFTVLTASLYGQTQQGKFMGKQQTKPTSGYETTSIAYRGGEGCLTSEFGQYPEGNFTPSCVGIV